VGLILQQVRFKLLCCLSLYSCNKLFLHDETQLILCYQNRLLVRKSPCMLARAAWLNACFLSSSGAQNIALSLLQVCEHKRALIYHLKGAISYPLPQIPGLRSATALQALSIAYGSATPSLRLLPKLS